MYLPKVFKSWKIVVRWGVFSVVHFSAHHLAVVKFLRIDVRVVGAFCKNRTV